ncbi:MAG: uroporphyrinogen-III C-methyltransferase [Cyclobacteriaceae bacterium]
MSKLSLIGAGPGDPELITLKAIRALNEAQVVLYDALANEELLDYCNEDCVKVYVGKKPGIHRYQQIYINDMIVDFAKQYDNVARLKGGDPFVFGRGHEEMEHALAHNIEVEIIPGITSAIAVPELMGIPVTKRGVNESFWTITGTTRSLELSKDVHLAAKSSATVLILMGMSKLDKIVNIFKEHRGKHEPIAIIQDGSTIHQKLVIGDMANIEELASVHRLGSPAIIVIGEVAKYGNILGQVSREYNEGYDSFA